MDLKHLQALVGIADYGSFSAAADALGTVQSNVSAHVARLERELDVELVDRSTGHLTEEGVVVVARTRRMLSELDAMVADVVALRHEVSGTARVGMIGTTGRWLAPLLLNAVRERHPHLRLMIIDGISSTLEPQIMSGVIDLAVVNLPVPGDDLVATPLFDEDLMLCVPVDHPLVEASAYPGTADEEGVGVPGVPLPMSTLGELELLLPSPGTVLRNEIDAAVRPAGVELKPLLELDGVRLLASLVFDGLGPAVLPATGVAAHLRNRFRMLPIDGLPPRHVGVATRRHGHPSAPARAVIEMLSELVADPRTRPEGIVPAPGLVL